MGWINARSAGKLNTTIDVVFSTHLRSSGIIFRPNSDKLIEMMRSQYGSVSRQIVKIIHNDSHKQIQHLQSTVLSIMINEAKSSIILTL